MKSRVALLTARPETIVQDYERLLGLAFAEPEAENLWDLVVARAGGGRWRPGRVSPPWQLDGVKDWVADDAGLLAVSEQGPVPLDPAQHRWQGLSEGRLGTIWGAEMLAASPYRTEVLVPALESSLEKGLALSPHWRGRRALLLPTLELGASARLVGAVEMLGSLLAPGRQSKRMTPEAEVMSEVIHLAKDVFAGLAVVVDATVWAARRAGGRSVVMDRHVLVAGDDPVAVDTVLAHLVGIREDTLPWLALADSRKLGHGRMTKIEIVGESGLMGLDFQVPEDTFGAGKRGILTRWASSVRSSNEGNRSSFESPWVRLFEDYASGDVS